MGQIVKRKVLGDDGNEIEIEVEEFPEIPVIVVDGGDDENIKDSGNISDDLFDISAS